MLKERLDYLLLFSKGNISKSSQVYSQKLWANTMQEGCQIIKVLCYLLHMRSNAFKIYNL